MLGERYSYSATEKGTFIHYPWIKERIWKNYNLAILFCAINGSQDILLPIACNVRSNETYNILYISIN